MIQNIADEENFSRQTLPLGIFKRFFFFTFPYLVLIGYSLAFINWATLGYLCFGLILFYLEVEKHFKLNKDIHSLQGNRCARMQDIFIFSNYKLGVYYLLLMFSVSLYILKFIVLLLYYYNTSAYQKIIEKIEPNNFELYFVEEETAATLIHSFLPNLAFLIIAAIAILGQSYTKNYRNEVIGRLRGVNISQYFFTSLIVLIITSFSATNVSFTTLLIVFVIALYFVMWGSKKEVKGQFFYSFAKILQFLTGLLIFTQYLASIDTMRNLMDGSRHWNFSFLGIIDMRIFIKDAKVTYFLFILLIIIKDYMLCGWTFWCFCHINTLC